MSILCLLLSELNRQTPSSKIWRPWSYSPAVVVQFPALLSITDRGDRGHSTIMPLFCIFRISQSLICRWATVRLRSSTSSLLDVRPPRRATVAVRSFATATCPRIRNGLPGDVTSATSLLTCRQKLKTSLFRQSYLDIILWLSLPLATAVFYLGYYKRFIM